MSQSIVFILSLFFSIHIFASDCMWTDSSYASGGMYSQNKKASLGWIFCEKQNLTSIMLERYGKSRKDWVTQYVKESFPGATKTTTVGIVSKNLAGQKMSRTVMQVTTDNEVYDIVFFFFSKNKKNYVFSSILLKRPYGKDLDVAAKEIDKVLREKKDLLK